MFPTIVSLILALAKALPVVEQILAQLETARANARAAQLHAAIDDAIAQARREAPVCPRLDCPLLRSLQHATLPGAGTPPPS